MVLSDFGVDAVVEVEAFAVEAFVAARELGLRAAQTPRSAL